MNFIEKYNLNITGAITVGADEGQELPFYIKNNIKNLAFFEPRPPAYEKLVKNIVKAKLDKSFTIHAYHVGLGERDEIIPMFTAGGGQASSFLKPKLHLQKHPEIVFRDDMVYDLPVKTLDSFKFSPSFNFLHLDVQGYELKVLKGGQKTLNNILALSTEVNIIELYEGCVMLPELDAFLKDAGFRQAELSITDFGWGDALYLKNL